MVCFERGTTMAKRKVRNNADSDDQEKQSDVAQQSLDEFVKEMFQTTPQAEADGMPSLAWLKEQFKTKSAAIRYLHSKNFTVNQIHKHLGIRYQHVRNVLSTELKRGPNEKFTLEEGISPSIKQDDD